MNPQSTNSEYRRLLKIAINGIKSAPRGLEVSEVLAYQSVIDMSVPCVTIPSRKMSEKFRFAEAAWILSGDNRVSSILPFNKNIGYFSDDGLRYFGAYGPKIVDQLPYVVSKLRDDPDSRQAVINIWRESPGATRDVPCTLSLQFVIRPPGVVHCIATMRSSDAWLGWPYDVFNFSCVAATVALSMPEKRLRLGNLFLTAGSQHIYKKNYEAVDRLLHDISVCPDSWNLQERFESFRDADYYKSTGERCDHFIEGLWESAHFAAERS